MRAKLTKATVLTTALWSALIAGVTMGCASGGFKLTRQYARFVNSQNIILRIVLYILTSVVFAVTLLADFLIFNTMDFWNGRVAQGTYRFEQDGKTYLVHHRRDANDLRESKIEISVNDSSKRQEILLSETPSHEIEVRVDGVLTAKVSDISLLPKLTRFDKSGKVHETRELYMVMDPTSRMVAAK